MPVFMGFGLLPMGIFLEMVNELKPAFLVDLLETTI